MDHLANAPDHENGGVLRPAHPPRGGRLVNRNVTAARGRTSMRFEPEFWSALEEYCHREGVTLAEAVQRMEVGHPPGGRTSAVRVGIMAYFRDAATEDGHAMAGHGRLEP